MIDSARATQAAHEGHLAIGIASLIRGEDGIEAVAAGRVIAETIIMWRTLLDSKLQR